MPTLSGVRDGRNREENAPIIARTDLFWRSKATLRSSLNFRAAGPYRAIIGGPALLWFVCTVDLSGASRIVMAGLEIDRRVEMAEATLRRLQQAEAGMRALALLLTKLTEQPLKARYVRGPDEVEAAINHAIEQL